MRVIVPGQTSLAPDVKFQFAPLPVKMVEYVALKIHAIGIIFVCFDTKYSTYGLGRGQM